MRSSSKPLMLAVMAIVATFAASSASAQVEVSAEDDGHCSPTCEIHVISAGTVGLYVGLLSAANEPAIGSAQSICNNEFDASVGEDGSVEITNQVLFGASCGLAPCPNASDPDHWPGLIEEPSAGAEHLVVTFCVVSNTLILIQCDLEVEISTTPPHDYELHTDPTGNGRAECLNNPVATFMGFPVYAGVQGTWHIESTPIEISH